MLIDAGTPQHSPSEIALAETCFDFPAWYPSHPHQNLSHGSAISKSHHEGDLQGILHRDLLAPARGNWNS